MKSFFAIVIATLYFSFSVGLTLRIHQCDDMSMQINEAILSPVSTTESDCHMEDSHACCSPEKTKSCCDDKETSNDCCVDSEVVLQIVEEQIASKNYKIISHPELNKIITRDLSKDFLKESHEKQVLTHPPPLIEDQHILFCSLTLYG